MADSIPGITSNSPGEVPPGDRNTQPGHFEPGRESVPFIILSPQDVIVILDSIQHDFGPEAIPVARNFAAQHVQFIQIALALAEVLPGQFYSLPHPGSKSEIVYILRVETMGCQVFAGNIDEALGDIFRK